jgi:hypothetical protein
MLTLYVHCLSYLLMYAVQRVTRPSPRLTQSRTTPFRWNDDNFQWPPIRLMLPGPGIMFSRAFECIHMGKYTSFYAASHSADLQKCNRNVQANLCLHTGPLHSSYSVRTWKCAKKIRVLEQMWRYHYHDMKAYTGSRSVAAIIFNFDAGWKWVVKFTFRPL